MRSLVLVLGLLGCRELEAAPDGWNDAEIAALKKMRWKDDPRPDPTNRWAQDPAAAALGQALFFDPGLSPSGSVSCATCHAPAHGFADPRPLSQGVGTTKRNAPAIPGSQSGPWVFWDGRADSLWAQAAGPVEHPAEMGSDRLFFVRRVTEVHQSRFEAVFGPSPDLSDPGRFPAHAAPGDGPAGEAWARMAEADRELVTDLFVKSLKAVAAYERLLTPQVAPFDRYVDALVAGDPGGGGELEPVQVDGLRLFLREGCVDCHHGAWFTDRAFHNLGLPFQGPFDGGRSIGAALVLDHEFNCTSRWSDNRSCPELAYLDPSFPDFQQAFKTPSLRNVALTPPYMHHGQVPDLRSVVDFYAELPGDAAVNHRELTLRPRDLDPGQRDAIVAFLGALTGEPWRESLTQPLRPDSAPPSPD